MSERVETSNTNAVGVDRLVMFAEHEKHETVLHERWRKNIKPMPVRALLQRIQRGAQPRTKTHKLDQKIRRIYPRGPAFEKYVIESQT